MYKKRTNRNIVKYYYVDARMFFEQMLQFIL